MADRDKKELNEDLETDCADENTYWPTLEQYDPHITTEQWKVMLSDRTVITEKCLTMLKHILELDGKSTCAQLSKIYGNKPVYYCNLAGSIGKRVIKKLNCPTYLADHQEIPTYAIPFVGRFLQNRLYEWKLRDELREALESMDLGTVQKETQTIKMTDVPQNTILYGPPGTAKTYHTILYAVAIIEKRSLAEIEHEPYESVAQRYQKYRSEGLIEFTTFHQSYSYEEFIEGIKPVMNNDSDDCDEIEYEISPGLFKRFCEKASLPNLKKEEKEAGINDSPTIWKVSLGGSGENDIRKECLANDHIRMGYDRYGENITSETHFEMYGGRNVLDAFIYKMQVGDLVLSCFNSRMVDAVGVITGDYEWHDAFEQYKRLRKVKWLVKDIREDITEANGSTMTLSTVYRLKLSLNDVMSIIRKYSPKADAVRKSDQNYVFIIDEINRGNISKIFGELITLIEPTKRIGQIEEALTILPYSKKVFGVPNNIYLIGTMNTADRSIATIDTALRRRFHFKEMQPNPDLLEGIFVDGLSIKKLLIRMNLKIGVLYDREHTIGHAYFMKLKESPTIMQLASVFKDHIIPLLQEYFYEDYEKIRLVLGDNRKQNEKEQFITAKEVNYAALFGDSDIGADDAIQYRINPVAFDNIEAYRAI